jgi:hypothetical protein
MVFGSGCQADFPAGFDAGNLPPAPTSPLFGDIASCLDESTGSVVFDCVSSNVCPPNVLGQNEPDQKQVNIEHCTLDFVFTRGTLLSRPRRIDLVVHLGDTVRGTTRVEGSKDGVNYKVVGFLNALPPGFQTNSRCLMACADKACSSGETCPDGKPCWLPPIDPANPLEQPKSGWCVLDACKPKSLALIDLSAGDESDGSGCNTMFDVQHIRFSEYTDNAGTQGAVTIDAIEAMVDSFQNQLP